MIWQFPPTLWLVCLFLTVSFKEEFLILLMSILSICSFKHDILEIVPKRYFWLMWQIVTCAFFYNFHSLRFTFRSECLSKFCRQWERKTSVAGGKSHCSQLAWVLGRAVSSSGRSFPGLGKSPALTGWALSWEPRRFPACSLCSTVFCRASRCKV